MPEFKFNEHGVCLNPEEIFNYYDKNIRVRLYIAEDQVLGWISGYSVETFGGNWEGWSSPVSTLPTIRRQPSCPREICITDVVKKVQQQLVEYEIRNDNSKIKTALVMAALEEFSQPNLFSEL